MKVLVYILLLIITQTVQVFSQWYSQNENVNGAKILFNNYSNGYILNSNGVYKKISDNWVKNTIEDASYLSDIFFLNENVGFVAGRSSIYKTTDAGISWLKLYKAPSNYWFRSVQFINESTGWVVGYISTSLQIAIILKTTDGGITWQNQFTGLDFTRFYDLFFIDEFNGLVFGDSTYKTTNGGLTWDIKNSLSFSQISTISDSVHFAKESPPPYRIFKSTDFGDSYIEIKMQPKANSGMFFGDSLFGFVWGSLPNGGPLIERTTDGGQSWDDISGFSHYRLSSMYFLDSDNGWASDGYTIYRSSDSGDTWEELKYQFRSISIIDSNNIFVSGNTEKTPYISVILKSVDGGNNWNSVGPNATGIIFSSCFIDSANGWFVGTNPDIIRTTDGGSSWITNYSSQSNTLYDVEFINKRIGWAVGESGTIIKSTDGGINWIPQNIDPTLDLSTIEVIDSNLCFINAGTYILKTVDGGNNWDVSYKEGYFSDIQFLNSTVGFSLDFWGKIIKTTDTGNNWFILSDLSLNYGGLENIFMVDNQVGFITTGTHNILKTTDGGYNWFLDTTLANSIFDMRFINVNTGWGVTSWGGILKTDNGGIISEVKQIRGNNLIPDGFHLSQNHPNPFNPITTIKFTISDLRFTTFKIYDVLGNEITTLVNEEKPAGSYEIIWNASDLPTGIYFYQIRAGKFVETKKMVLLK